MIYTIRMDRSLLTEEIGGVGLLDGTDNVNKSLEAEGKIIWWNKQFSLESKLTQKYRSESDYRQAWRPGQVWALFCSQLYFRGF